MQKLVRALSSSRKSGLGSNSSDNNNTNESTGSNNSNNNNNNTRKSGLGVNTTNNSETREGTSFRTASSGGGLAGTSTTNNEPSSPIPPLYPITTTTTTTTSTTAGTTTGDTSPDGGNKIGRATKTPIRIVTKPSAEDDSKRGNALAEIESSERSYLQHISAITNLYMPAIRLLPDLDPQQIQLIEGNIKEVVRLAEQFLEGLEKGESSGIPFGRVYTTYTLYCDGHMKRQEILKELREYRTDLVDVLEKIRKENKVLSFDSLIIMPIQRLPRYVLLLQEVVKRTPPTHPEYSKTKKALDDVTTLADTVNKSIKFLS
jgi:hypothetical protein